MTPGDWDPVAISKMLRCQHDLDLEPSYYLDPPVCLGTSPIRYEVYVIPARMTFEVVGTRVVRWTGSKWEVEQAKKTGKREEIDPLLSRK